LAAYRLQVREAENLAIIEHVFAMYGAGCAIATIAFFVLSWRATEAPSND
jgi:hypothetical protein